MNSGNPQFHVKNCAIEQDGLLIKKWGHEVEERPT
jgi:hypothetical protein